jgi:hypothetical protein
MNPMRKFRLLSLSVPLLLTLPGIGLCDGIGDCRTVAAILSVYPPLEVVASAAPVRSALDATERPGCRVRASGPTELIFGEVDPAEAVGIYFAGTGWEEDARLAADGPGTMSFAFRREGILCRTEGGAHAWVEDGESFMSDRYEIAVECAPQPE